MKAKKDSILMREGRQSIIKSSKSTTIYFGEEHKDEDIKATDATPDLSVKNNKKKWSDLREKMKSFHKLAEEEEQKQLEKASDEVSEEDREKLRKQINQVLNKAKKIHELKKSDAKDSKSSKMVIVRPEGKNCDKAVSVVRIRDISQVRTLPLIYYRSKRQD
jgi:vacuolar-type H+-ATPase subunit H